MGDFIELGLEGADKLIDKHFDKIPDKLVDPDTYKPRRKRNSKDQGQPQQQPQLRRQSVGGGESEYYRRQQQQQYQQQQHHHQQQQHRRSPSPLSPFTMGDNNGRPRDYGNSSPFVQDGPFITPPFSTMPPVQRAEYTPSTFSSRGRESFDAPLTSRPTQMRRRSSSYHGPRHRDDFYSSDESSDDDDRRYEGRSRNNNTQIVQRNRNSSSNNLSTKSKGSGGGHHRNLKEEVSDQFTNSKEGLAGGALGALVAGWATHKVLESKGRGHGDADKAWTLLGAAVGGLAVNSIVDKWEDHKEEKRDGERERERERSVRHGGDSRSRDGRSEFSSRGGGGRDWEAEEDRRYYR